MANTVAVIRTDIYNVLTTLDASNNIGLVHDYERWALQWEDVLSVLRDPVDEIVKSWMVVYQGFVPVPEASFFSQDYDYNKSLTVRAHRFLVRGVYAVDDANESEKTFATLTETVINALDSDETLHDQDRYWGDPPMLPAELSAFEIRSFAGVLCHIAEISILINAVHIGGS